MTKAVNDLLRAGFRNVWHENERAITNGYRGELLVKTLYMHIGWRKTGSSAIQSYVTHAAEDGRLQDVVVAPIGQLSQQLVAGDVPVAHHLLANFNNKKNWHKKWAEFVEFISNSTDSRFLLTSELFSSNFSKTPNMLVPLAKRLEIFDQVIMPFWVRRQDQYMASIRVQNAKHGGVTSTYKTEVKRFPPDANYLQIATMLKNRLPNVTLRPHLYVKTANIVEDFCKAIEIAPDETKAARFRAINQSVSPEMYRYQGCLNRVAKKLEITPDPLQSVLLKAWDTLPQDMKKETAMPMSREERVAIIEHFSVSNRKFCRRFGFDQAYFNPTSEEIDAEPKYNIPDTVSNEFRQIMRNALEEIKGRAKETDYVRLLDLVEKEAALN